MIRLEQIAFEHFEFDAFQVKYHAPKPIRLETGRKRALSICRRARLKAERQVIACARNCGN
jgi:hypothetical protein